MMSQVYVPDPASVGQHLHDAAVEMVGRGYHVRVLTSGRGYDAPRVRYPARETIDGVEVRRLPLASFGKRSLVVRLVAQLSFLVQVVCRGLLVRELDGMLVSTSPPMCGAAAWVVGWLRRVPIVYWVMDINPDQAVALGAVRRESLLVRLFDALNRRILRRADAVMTLDRFMAARLLAKHDVSQKLSVFPPWPHEDHVTPVPHAENPFRAAQGWSEKFVVMYSGNHSPANPVTTVLEAARRLRHRKDIVFAFVGGGCGKREVREAIERGLGNIADLPYQSLEDLKYSLSAADVHLVTLGNASVGLVHPCKVYGAMAVARPILFLGPAPSHVADLLDRHDVGRQVRHGDVPGMVEAITALAEMPAAERAAMGARARHVVRAQVSKEILCRRFGNVVERALGRLPRAWRDEPIVPARDFRKKAA